MSKFDKGIAVTAFVVFLVIVVFALLQIHSDPEVDLGPPPINTPIERVYTPSEATIEVSAYFSDQRVYGKGIIVQHNGQMFVLTSSMIFNKDVERIEVETLEWIRETEILHQNNVWGLVALECPLLAYTPFIELNDDPNIPPLIPVGINGWSASTLEYINDDWVLLDDLPEEDCTGCPVVQNGYVVGIVVGINRINRDQAIMVSNRALKEFCDQVTLVNDVPNVSDAPPVFHPSANPNILFGNEQ